MNTSCCLRLSRLLLASGLFLSGFQLASALPVFPGAVGYGTQTVAARGTVNDTVGPFPTVYKVTTLADTNGTPTAGMLRYGIETLSGPRVIIFEVSGVIHLRKNITIRHDRGFLTIAGQTAPAGGITLKNAGIIIKSNDILIQHIAIRPGDLWWNADGTVWQQGQPAPGCSITQPAGYSLPCPDNRDAIILNCDPTKQTYNIVLDHVTVSWAADENISLWGAAGNPGQPIRDVTISNSFIYEGLRFGPNTQLDPTTGHSAGLIIGPNSSKISLVRNAFAFNCMRNPVIGYQTVGDVRLVNNFIYAPGTYRGNRMGVSESSPQNDTTYTVRASMHGNVAILHANPEFYGAGTNATQFISTHSDAATHISFFLKNNRLWHPTYIGNWVPSSPDYNSTLVHQGTVVTQLATDPFTDDGVQPWPDTWTPAQMEAAIMANSGARPAVRDAVDARIVAQMSARTVRDWLDDPAEWAGYSGHGSDGYPTATATRTLDVTNVTGAAGQADPDGNGYTVLEEWLHSHSALVQSGAGDALDATNPILDNFEDNNTSNWTPAGTTSWSTPFVGTSGTPEHNRVYAQTDTAADARSILSGTNWTNQVIQVDVKPTAFNGTDRWFGVFGRYRDTSNYYYLILRTSGIVDLKKIVNGTPSSLLATPPTYSVSANTTYRLKLTLNGTSLTGTVSTWNTGTNTWTNVVNVSATDSAIPSGRAAIGMFKAAAQYNNVLATPNTAPTNLFGDDFQDGDAAGWTPTGGTWSVVSSGGSLVYRQSNTTGGYHALRGSTGWTDQIVEIDAKANTFNGTNKFFGIIARHLDASNYYYFILRSSNTIELKKYDGGAQSILDSAAFTVSTTPIYDLRLDAIGPTINAYINGRLVLEAQDGGNPTGQAGVKVFDASAEYDNVLVTRP